MVRNISGMLGSVVKRGRDREPNEPARQVCFVCASSLSDSQPFAHYRVCPTCRFHYTVTARERISTLADPSTFRETNRAVTSVDPALLLVQGALQAAPLTRPAAHRPDGGCCHRQLRHRRQPRGAHSAGLRLHGRQHGVCGGGEGRACLRARRQEEQAGRCRRNQWRRPHSGGNPLLDADGQDQHHGGEAGCEGVALHHGPLQPRLRARRTQASPTSPT